MVQEQAAFANELGAPPEEQALDSADRVMAFQLLTAMDRAVKDLRHIALLVGSPTARKQVDDCRKKLQGAIDAAIQDA